MTNENQRNAASSERPLNRNKWMSGDAGGGGRNPDRLGRDRAAAAGEPPAQDQSAVEAFDEEGAGIAAKE